MPKLLAPICFTAWLLAALAAVEAGAATFTDLVVFGDSLSDVGNVDDSSFGLYPGSNYWNGRFSNGPVWVESLSSGLGLGAITRSEARGDDFAYGGAKTTGTGGLTGVFIDDLDEQVNSFVNARTASASSLYVVWAGSNDFIQGETNTTTVATRITNQINRLIADGARQFLVPNLPLLGSTPRFNDSPATAAQYTARTQAFNATLSSSLAALENGNPALTFYQLDVARLFAQAIASPATFGLTNVVDSAAPGLQPGPGSYDRSKIVANPNQYLFWDDLHPTATGHSLLAVRALALVDGVPGDFDADGLIDAADLAAWRQGYGAAALARRTNGDADGDRDVDGADFLVWQRNLGALRGQSATAAVPEPATASLLGITAVVLLRRRYRDWPN